MTPLLECSSIRIARASGVRQEPPADWPAARVPFARSGPLGRRAHRGDGGLSPLNVSLSARWFDSPPLHPFCAAPTLFVQGRDSGQSPLNYIPDMPSEFQLSPWEDDNLTAPELAEFLHVEVSAVRRWLRVRGNAPISKRWLWTLIIGGCSDSKERLVELDQRIDRAQRRLRVPVAKSVKRAVIERDQGRCRYCGRLLASTEIQLDHVRPRCLGGGRQAANLVVACLPCNTRKGRRLPHEVGMSILPIGGRLRGRIRKHYRPIPAPPESYEELVMGMVSSM